MDKREKQLAALSPRAQAAFAAASAERAVREGARFIKPSPARDTRLRKALDWAWRYAGGENVNYAKDVKALHHGIAADIPNVDDADGDEILMEVMSAVARTLVVLEQPDRSASAARSAADATLGLMGLVYEKPKDAEANEREWQDAALEVVKSAGGKPVSPESFASIPDWKRGAVRKVFKNRLIT